LIISGATKACRKKVYFCIAKTGKKVAAEAQASAAAISLDSLLTTL
jgi:hypothetical protein